MNLTKFNLLLAAVLVIILYFLVPDNKAWLDSKALSPNNNMLDQMQNQDISYRNQYRFGGSYTVYKDMERVLSTHKGVILLIPTTDYLRSIQVKDVDMPEPAVLYYFTGINAVMANSPKVEEANWALVASKRGGMRLLEMKSKPQLDSIIATYKSTAHL